VSEPRRGPIGAAPLSESPSEFSRTDKAGFAAAMDGVAPRPPSFLDGGGEMGAAMRAHQWAATAVGSPHEWPAPLRTMVRMMLTTNHSVFIFWGDDLTCFYNDAYAASLGPERHPRILGMPGSVAWSEIWPLIGPQIELVRRGQGATWHEDQLVPITRHGRIEDVFWTYRYGPIHDDDAPHGVGGVLVLCYETTDRVMKDARVRADLDRFQQLFEHSPGFICVVRGPEHRFQYCNPSYFALVGRGPELISRTVAEALPEVVSQGYIEMMDRVFKTGEAHSGVTALVILNGVERLVDFVYQPLRDTGGPVTGILVQGIDVTKRELAQAALVQSATRLRIATDAASLGIHEYDIRSGVIEWDGRVSALWGVHESSHTTYDVFMSGIVAEDRALTQRALDAAFDPVLGGSYHAEYRVRDTAGVVRWIRATGRVEFENDRAVRMIGTVHDISIAKRDEAELMAADRQKEVFLATLAHELRNPLAPIRNAAHILAMPGVGKEQIRWAHQVITRQATHMATLLDDLLDVARLAQGRMELKREHVEIDTILKSAVESVRRRLEAKQHVLSIEVPARGAMVFADPVRLSQVFSNLLGNAIKYMAPAGRIEMLAQVDDTQVQVFVRDSGVGMSAAVMPHIFGMFQQSEASLELAEGGIGIGLSIVRAIVELHGGAVRASSDGPGCGSELVVVLPLAPATAAARGEKVLRGDGPGTVHKRILVADDNQDAAESMAILLGLEGHLVQIAFDGIEALEMIASFRPDIVLLDIGMPRMNGYDVARRVREQDATRQIRLIALTGWGGAHDRERALTAGFDAHLTKPPDVQQLIAEICR